MNKVYLVYRHFDSWEYNLASIWSTKELAEEYVRQEEKQAEEDGEEDYYYYVIREMAVDGLTKYEFEEDEDTDSSEQETKTES